VTDAHLGELQQYAYITCNDKEGDEPFTEMLAKLSFKPGMDVKIIVGSSDAADKIRRLAEAGFNETNPAQHPQQGHRC
jgi:hypothetical protein